MTTIKTSIAWRMTRKAACWLLPLLSSSLSMAQTASTTQLSCPVNAQVGVAVTCFVTVDTGAYIPQVQSVTVTVVENGATVGSGNLSYYDWPGFYRASVTLPASGTTMSAAGSHSLIARTPATSSIGASDSSAITMTVQKHNTTSTLSVSPTTAGAAQVVTLTASVSGGLDTTGNVTFRNGGISLGTASLSGTQATFITSFATTGTHAVTATYNGDTLNASSTSSAVNANITATTPTTSTLSVTPSSLHVGDAATLLVNITGSIPTGNVVFRNGSAVLGSATASNGQASLNHVFGVVGQHTLTAHYWGDTANGSSTSAPSNVTVSARSTATTLVSALTQAGQGQPIALTATVAGTNPGGTVTFLEGATTLGTASVAGGVANLNASFTVPGLHTLTAAYGGDANHGASTSGTVSVQIDVGPQVPVGLAPVVNYEYDALGKPTKTTVAPGLSGFNFVTQTSYDSLSRTKDMTDPRNGLTRLQYDGGDRVTQVTDPRNLVTQYPRNGLGDATQIVSPDTGTAGHTYDEAGNLKTRTDSRGALATYTYDALNRLTQIVYSKTGMTTQTFAHGYDQTGSGFSHGVGRLTSTTHPSGSTQYAYDAQGRLVTDVQRIDVAAGANTTQIVNTVGYAYDAAGNVTQMTYPSGARLTISYTNGQPSGMSLAKDGSSAAVPLISQIQFEPFGAVKSWQWHLASGTQAQEWKYDLSGRPVRYRLGNLLRDVSYDAAGRIVSYTHYSAVDGTAQSTNDQSFGYDQLGRLTSVVANGNAWSIAYDANGNRTGVTLNGSTRTYTTEATSNRLTSVSNPARDFGYDAAGNTTSDTANYASTYDASGRLSTLTRAGITTAYSYNGFGQRQRKFSSTGAASTVIFAYDQGGQLLGEYSNTGAVLREYVWIGSMPVAMFVPNGSNPPTVYYLHTDHLNTPRLVTDTANNLRWRWLAEPFGTSLPEESPGGLGLLTHNLRFPGQYADSESGLYYNYFRDYDSTTGRYTQSDPIGLRGGINTYAYVGGNPLQYVDPLGHNRKGGKSGQWWEFTDRNFQRWFHQCVKQPGDRDATRDELADAYATWVEWGKPDGMNGCGGPPPAPAPAPAPAPESPACGESCKRVLKSVRDAVTGTLILIFVFVCATS